MGWHLQQLHCFASRKKLALSAAICALLFAQATPAQNQTDGNRPEATVTQTEAPVANPGRPTVSTPAALTPVGYFQFETGVLAAWHSLEFSSQTSLNEVIKYSVCRRVEFLASTNPYAHSDTLPTNASGGVSLGVQGIALFGEGARPTIAIGYFHTVYSGDAPDIDIGSPSNGLILLGSADIKGFHFDTNYLFNELSDQSNVRRAQFGQTLSVSHGLAKQFGISGEIWHFTQPFLRGNAVGNLWALNYNLKSNLVIDAGFNRGLTTTSTRWEIFSGFTYLLPHKLKLH